MMPKKKDYNAKDKGNTMQKIGSTIQKLKGNTIQKIKGNKLLNWHSSSLEASLHPSLGKYLATTSLLTLHRPSHHEITLCSVETQCYSTLFVADCMNQDQ